MQRKDIHAEFTIANSCPGSRMGCMAKGDVCNRSPDAQTCRAFQVTAEKALSGLLKVHAKQMTKISYKL